MTKEELKQESKEYAKPWKNSLAYVSIKDAYLAGAEPREKRIEELEQQLSAMEKGTCDVCKVKDAEFYEKRIAELEAQIEKMKSDYEQLLDEKIELEDRLTESRECY